ncbi:MAG TPA: hypothetical protein VK843_04270 [Planctomycetota bacterium]|nr:hypothetical protein [Planctomycetota bacterium]
MTASNEPETTVMERVFALGFACAATAFAAGIVALTALQIGLPPSDTAYGQDLRSVFPDPFVVRVWLALVLTGGVIAFGFAVPLLWPVQLSKAFPWVACVTLVAAGAGSFVRAPLGPILGLVAGIAAMIWARSRVDWRISEQ